MVLIAWFLSILHRAGAFQKFQWETTAKQSAASKREDGVVTLTKRTTAVIRTGVEYKNLAQNADRETGSLPWGEWHLYPFILTHKDEFYGRIYADPKRMRSIYFVDGVEVSRSKWFSYQPESADKVKAEAAKAEKAKAEGREPKPKPKVLTFAIRLENLSTVPVTVEDLEEIDA